MITNLNLSLLNGGRYLCTPHWNAMINRHEDCYKLYFPVKGNASVIIDGKEKELKAGNVYFISGLHLDGQFCKESMDVFWVHFMPDSLKMRYLLNNCTPFDTWSAKDLIWAAPFFRQLNKLFKRSTIPEEMTLKEAPADLMCRIHGILNYLLGHILNSAQKEINENDIAAFKRLEKSIDYMDKNYLISPSLEQVARQSHLAPNYFHRLFKSIFHTTPHNYMLNRRIDLAKQLISSTALTIKEIAFQTGYENEFHFSRTFKKQTNLSPSAYRKNQPKA